MCNVKATGFWPQNACEGIDEVMSFVQKLKDKEKHKRKQYKSSFTQRKEERLSEIKRDLIGIIIKCNVWTCLDDELNKPTEKVIFDTIRNFFGLKYLLTLQVLVSTSFFSSFFL